MQLSGEYIMTKKQFMALAAATAIGVFTVFTATDAIVTKTGHLMANNTVHSDTRLSSGEKLELLDRNNARYARESATDVSGPVAGCTLAAFGILAFIDRKDRQNA
jgi:hypothetical protein